MKKAALYFRCSTSEQDFDSQLDFCRRWCALHKFAPVEYFDKASGALRNRPGLDQMLADCRKGKIHAVVVYKLDRLGRTTSHLLQMIEELLKLEVAFISVTQGIDTRQDNPMSDLIIGILSAFAQHERKTISERTRAGLAAAKARGVKFGRPKDTGRKYPIAAFRASGLSLYAFCKEMQIPEASMRWAIQREVRA